MIIATAPLVTAVGQEGQEGKEEGGRKVMEAWR
jgi:hypothetical protein